MRALCEVLHEINEAELGKINVSIAVALGPILISILAICCSMGALHHIKKINSDEQKEGDKLLRNYGYEPYDTKDIPPDEVKRREGADDERHNHRFESISTDIAKIQDLQKQYEVLMFEFNQYIYPDLRGRSDTKYLYGTIFEYLMEARPPAIVAKEKAEERQKADCREVFFKKTLDKNKLVSVSGLFFKNQSLKNYQPEVLEAVAERIFQFADL